MTRIPLSFYLNIIAGLIVAFNHFAASETGDNALNKVTGALGRFYVLFRDTALTVQHGCTSGFELALCGPAIDNVFPRGTAAYLKVHYCHLHAQQQDSGDREGPHGGGYGGSDFAFVYYQPPAVPLAPRTLIETQDSLVRSSFNLEWPTHSSRLARAVWDRSSDATATMGALLLRTCASWWWFRAPLKTTGLVLAAHSIVSVLGNLFGARAAIGWITQAYAVVAVDFLRCIQWEVQRRGLEAGVVMAERVHGMLF